jgi:hypothetical protein
MKKGKTARIIGVKNAKVTYGTVNSVEFKSVYLNIQTWVDPKKESENWQRIVLNFSREIKHAIYEKLDKNLFDEKFIVDLDLRASGLNLGKKSFANLEINFYIKDDKLDFKSNKLKESLKKIMKNIFDTTFSKNEYFKFFLTKNPKNLISNKKLQEV